jgi:hypothetical protein
MNNRRTPRSTSQSIRRIALLVCVLCGLPQFALAGVNGQQISFRAPGAHLEQVRISGDNQHDRPVTWISARAGVACREQPCDEVRTQGWWFKGKVTVEYRVRGEGAALSCYFYVNERQSGDWVDVLAPGGNDAPAPKCQTAGPANRIAIPAVPTPLPVADREIPHGACDRRAGPLEDRAVATATADLIAVVTVTAIQGDTGTLRIEQALKSPPGVAVPRVLEVPGIAADSINRICRGNAAQVGRRYIVLLWSPVVPGAGFELLAEDGGLLAWTAGEQQALQAALASPQPVSPWNRSPDGILTQLTLAPNQPGSNRDELDLLLVFRNIGAQPVQFSYRSWPPAGQSRCEVGMVAEDRQQVAARDVPIAQSDIEDYFGKNNNGRRFDWITAAGGSSTFLLSRVTTAAAGWGYKEELGFKYYPAPPGSYSVSVQCVNFRADGAKITAGPMLIRLPPR